MNAQKLIAIIAGVAIVGGALYFFSRPPKIPDDKALQKAYNQALSGDEKAKSEALEWVELENPKFRKRAATVLGYFDDEEANRALKKLLTDKDEKVRVETFNAITAKKSLAREKILIENIDAEGFTDYERTRLCMSLSRMSKTADTKRLAQECVAKIFIESQDKKARQFGSTYLAQAEIRSPELIKVFRQEISRRDPTIMANAVKYLTLVKDKDFLRGVERLYFAKDNHMSVQKVLIEMMSKTCIPNRFAAFQNFLNSKARQVRSIALLQMAFHNHPKTVSMLKAFIAKTAVEDEKTVAKRTLERLESGLKDSCS